MREGSTNEVFLEFQRTHLEQVSSKWQLLAGKEHQTLCHRFTNGSRPTKRDHLSKVCVP
jgi:hypothetical protein